MEGLVEFRRGFPGPLCRLHEEGAGLRDRGGLALDQAAACRGVKCVGYGRWRGGEGGSDYVL